MIKEERKKRVFKVDKGKALLLRAKGMSYKDIGKTFGTRPAAICKHVKPIIDALIHPELQTFRKRELDILDSAKMRFITASLEPGKMKKASTLQLTTAYSQLYDKSALIQGRATANINIHNSIQYADDKIKASEQALMALITGKIVSKDDESISDPVDNSDNTLIDNDTHS